MSRDDYVVVRKFADGWRWAHGFASGDDVTPDDFKGPYPNPWDAQDAAIEAIHGWPEYGVEIERPDRD